MSFVSVAIDGPSGAGKSTIAKAVARALGYTYVDTGAIYRTVGVYVYEKGVSPKDAAAVTALLPDIKIEIVPRDDAQHMILNGRDVTDKIREHVISQYASDVSAIPAVRAFLLDMQRAFAASGNVIMDGRDIGTVVLPDATVKIFLSADATERARRRHRELSEKGQDIPFETVLADLEARDANDAGRAVAPLVPAKDAVLADTTQLTLEESIALVRNLIEKGRDK